MRLNHRNVYAAGNMRRRKPVAVVAAMLLAGAALGASTTHGNRLRANGTRLHWSLNHPAAAGSSGLLLVAQGSGCQSALASAAVQAAHAVAPGFTLLTVEKYGVSPNADLGSLLASDLARSSKLIVDANLKPE